MEVVDGAEEAPMNFNDQTLGGLMMEIRRRVEMICEVQRECRRQSRIQWRLGGGTGPYIQGSMLKIWRMEGEEWIKNHLTLVR